MTLLEIVEQTGKTERTIQRRVEAFNRDNGTDHPTGRYSIITDEALLQYMLHGKPKVKKPVLQNGSHVQEPVLRPNYYKENGNPSLPEPPPVPAPPPATVFKNGKRVLVSKTKDAKETATLFTGNKEVDLVAGFLLILTDGISMGWIAKQAYNNDLVFWPFLLVGLAVGYVAIKSIINYEGRESDGWAAGFFAVQLLLHLSALGIFGPEWSLIIGKISIAVCIPVASAGLAVSQKSIKK
jgi:hypothetical protein